MNNTINRAVSGTPLQLQRSGQFAAAVEWGIRSGALGFPASSMTDADTQRILQRKAVENRGREKPRPLADRVVPQHAVAACRHGIAQSFHDLARRNRKPRPGSVRDAVMRAFNVSLEGLAGRRGTRRDAEARMACWAILHYGFNLSHGAIATEFDKDRTAVVQAMLTHGARAAADPGYCGRVELAIKMMAEDV